MILKLFIIAVALVLIRPASLPAQTFTVLHAFSYGSDGAYPYAGMTLGGGTLYGTTQAGGSGEGGTIFKINLAGNGFSAFKHFLPVIEGTNNDGATPLGRLVLSGGTLYGTASVAGLAGGGTVFQISTNGTNFVVLHHFTNSPDGYTPYGSMVLGEGALYGTTENGGGLNYGTVFQIGTNGENYATLNSFTNFGIAPDGVNPVADLLLSGGVLYGTTLSGGSDPSYDWGEIFSINTNGTGYSVLKNFQYTDGTGAYGNLARSGSTLFGTTVNGDDFGFGNVYELDQSGSGYSVLHHFKSGSDGANPWSGLVLNGGTLYGATEHGGASDNGTVFEINTDGSGYRVLQAFSALKGAGNLTNLDGALPTGGLVVISNALYGTTSAGGSLGYGTVFKIDLGSPSQIPLHISKTGPSTVMVWWVPGSGSYALQTNGNLSVSTWISYGGTINSSGGTNSVTMSPPTGDLFFRLLGN